MKQPKQFLNNEPVAVIVRNKTFVGCYIKEMEGELCHAVSFPAINYTTGLLRLESFYFRDKEVLKVAALTLEKTNDKKNGKNGNGRKA